MSALFLPALCIAVILAGLLARTNVYDAFVRGAEEGLATLIQIAPCWARGRTASSMCSGADIRAMFPAITSRRLERSKHFSAGRLQSVRGF